MIDAEYEEVEGTEGELDLSADDSLPWLEADEEEEAGSDNTAIILLGIILLGLAAVAVAAVWLFGSKVADETQAADGSVIEAPEGPYKERPEDPGGKEFAGTGNVAPVVGEGGTPDGVMDTDGNAGSASADGNAGTNAAAGANGNAQGANASGNTNAGAQDSGQTTTAASRGGVAVQLAAYSSRSRAEQGWQELSRRTEALSGMRYRIEEGVVDIGTVYRLQAVASDRAAADRLCANLKSDGIDCQVKG